MRIIVCGEYGGSTVSHCQHDRKCSISQIDASLVMYYGWWGVRMRPPSSECWMQTMPEERVVVLNVDSGTAWHIMTPQCHISSMNVMHPFMWHHSKWMLTNT